MALCAKNILFLPKTPYQRGATAMNPTEPSFIKASPIAMQTFLSKLPMSIEFCEEYKTDSPHWHDYVQIWYVERGTLIHTVNNKVYIQKPGSFITVPPYTVHNIDTTSSPKPPRFALISFSDRFLLDNGFRFFSYFRKYARFEERELPLFRELDGKIAKIGERIVARLEKEFSKGNNMSFRRLARILSNLLRVLTGESRSADRRGFICSAEKANAITNAVRYMTNHYSEKISLDMLCSVSRMSRSSFTKSFRAVCGRSSSEYLLSIRLSRAMLLLGLTDLNLTEIAKSVGLVTKNRLAHEFSNAIGIPPMEYRRRIREDAIECDRKLSERRAWFAHTTFNSYDHSTK